MSAPDDLHQTVEQAEAAASHFIASIICRLITYLLGAARGGSEPLHRG
jgi:hypothetical protein